MSRRFTPERNLEPPENYMMDPPYCEDCKEEECLLDFGKECPEQEKANRAAYVEWKAGEHSDNTKKLKNLDTLAELMTYDGVGEHLPSYPIVCICGSMRFRKEWEKWACILSELKPMHVVLTAHCFDHSKYHGEDRGSLRLKRGLDLLHWYKIYMSDWVFIIDVDGYIGESTRREIKVAERLGKRVRYMSKWGDEIE